MLPFVLCQTRKGSSFLVLLCNYADVCNSQWSRMYWSVNTSMAILVSSLLESRWAGEGGLAVLYPSLGSQGQSTYPLLPPASMSSMF